MNGDAGVRHSPFSARHPCFSYCFYFIILYEFGCLLETGTGTGVFTNNAEIVASFVGESL